MSATAIEWATDVWNPQTGCDRVSPGCAHCYALELAPRLRAMGQAKYVAANDGGKASGPAFGLTLHPEHLTDPLDLGARRDGQRRRIFVNSMSDLFHEDVPREWLVKVLSVIRRASQHDFLVLTKRPDRMLEQMAAYYADQPPRAVSAQHPIPNLWLGVTIENRRFVDRADLLRETPAAVRFISAEPLLGPLVPDAFSPVFGRIWHDRSNQPGLSLAAIDWLIVGGESGSHHRSCLPEWARALRDQAQAARTAFFFKQWGGRTPKAGGRELDGRTWDELPTTTVASTTDPERGAHAA